MTIIVTLTKIVQMPRHFVVVGIRGEDTFRYQLISLQGHVTLHKGICVFENGDPLPDHRDCSVNSFEARD